MSYQLGMYLPSSRLHQRASVSRRYKAKYGPQAGNRHAVILRKVETSLSSSVWKGAWKMEMEPKMRVELSEIKPNPLRDFKIDPIDDERVAALTESIKEDRNEVPNSYRDGFGLGAVIHSSPSSCIRLPSSATRPANLLRAPTATTRLELSRW